MMGENTNKKSKHPMIENSGGHRSWNFNAKTKANKSFNAASKQSFGKGRKKV